MRACVCVQVENTSVLFRVQDQIQDPSSRASFQGVVDHLGNCLSMTSSLTGNIADVLRHAHIGPTPADFRLGESATVCCSRSCEVLAYYVVVCVQICMHMSINV